MGRSQNVRKSSNTLCKVGAVFSRKGHLATPVRKTTSNVNKKFAGRTRKKLGTVCTPERVSERRGSIGLSPIHESSYQDNYVSVVSAEKQRNPPPPVHRKDMVSSSDISTSTNRDGTSDMIMPSGVSSFLLDFMDTSSPIFPISPPSHTSSDTSLPSPEIFRRADEEKTLEFSVEEVFELQVVKNSTLLDVSHAVDIDMRQPPNLSSILEVSRTREEIVLEKDGKSLRSFSFTEVTEMKVCGVGSPQRRENVLRAPFKQPRKVERARPARCRKKVTFHESVLRQELQRDAGRMGSNGLGVAKQEMCGSSGAERRRSFLEMGSDRQLMEDVGSGSIVLDGEEDDGEDSGGGDRRTLPCTVPPRPARFFDFADSAEKEAFLEKRRGKLPNEFPSGAHPLPYQLEPVHVKFKNSEVHDPDELHEVCWMQLFHEGENFFHNPCLKKVVSKEGVFYEDYGEVRRFHGPVPLQKNLSPES